MTPTADIDREACACESPLVVSEVADWKVGNPTGYYCQKCGHFFGWSGGYEP